MQGLSLQAQDKKLSCTYKPTPSRPRNREGKSWAREMLWGTAKECGADLCSICWGQGHMSVFCKQMWTTRVRESVWHHAGSWRRSGMPAAPPVCGGLLRTRGQLDLSSSSQVPATWVSQRGSCRMPESILKQSALELAMPRLLKASF